MASPDYYEILQVSPKAEPEVIEAAYKRLALKYHPDRNPEPAAEPITKLLNEAYEVLSDAAARQSYDAGRIRSSQPPPSPAELARAAVNRGDEFFGKSDYQQAFREYTEAVQLVPKRPRACRPCEAAHACQPHFVRAAAFDPEVRWPAPTDAEAQGMASMSSVLRDPRLVGVLWLLAACTFMFALIMLAS